MARDKSEDHEAPDGPLHHRFDLIGDASDSFWEIWLVDSTVTIRSGRSGTDGKVKVTELASVAEARQAYERALAHAREIVQRAANDARDELQKKLPAPGSADHAAFQRVVAGYMDRKKKDEP